MKQPYLIQRLNAATKTVNPFSFGGGIANGTLSKEGFDILRTIFSFDYMGAAEFEWGAVPTALKALVESNLTTVQIQPGDSSTWIGILCPKEISTDVYKYVCDASVGNTGNLKEHLGLKEALAKEKYARTLGWLKIEDDTRCKEPFMFFIDKAMFEDTCKLFGVND